MMLEYRVEEENPEKLREITSSIRGLGTLFDVLDLFTPPSSVSTILGNKDWHGKGHVKVHGVFGINVYLIHLLTNQEANIAAFLFDKRYQTFTDPSCRRVVGFYDSEKEISQFTDFWYGSHVMDFRDPVYETPRQNLRVTCPISELRNFKIGPPHSVDIAYNEHYNYKDDEEIKKTVSF